VVTRKAMDRPLVIDGNSLVVRSIMTSGMEDLKIGGAPTGGVYGGLNSLRKIVEGHAVSDIIVFFDYGVPPHRFELLPEYKQRRREKRSRFTDEEKAKLFGQIDAFRRILPMLGAKTLRYRDREADDGVAAAVRVLRAIDEVPIVVTSDKDLYQLLTDPSVRIYDLNLKETMSAHTVKERYGVSIDSWLVYKALVGDNSDGIDGIHGCGEGRAAQLLREAEEEYNEGTEGEFFGWEPPAKQARYLAKMLKRRDKLSKWQQAVIDGADYIQTVLQVIDLSDSFGGTDRLRESLLEDTAVDQMKFLGRCSKLGFASITGSPMRFLRPFINAQNRRERRDRTWVA